MAVCMRENISGQIVYSKDLSPKIFPQARASDWGEDKYGLWMAFTVKDVRQVFRWCEPGIFEMGSPSDEPGRIDYETKHEVTLSEGFWLADTTVTQALWELVMGENPSKFKGVERPVENVGWDDAKSFIGKFNKKIPELSVRLPWEAEWEYACRAGTTTAFSFGGKEDLSLERVNYSGKWDDYNLKGETKEVKSYPPNTWGLYEMHGNVWEWCADYWQDDLGVEPVVDPHGPENGDSRVVRGGSWIFIGRHVRSAFRSRGDPGFRSDYLGFRLALGYEHK